MIINNVDIILPDKEVFKGHISIKGEYIESINNSIAPESDTIIDGQGLTAIPGLIDLHIHGACGVSITDDDEKSLEKLSKNLTAFGITGFLWTTMAAHTDEMDKVMKQVAKFENNVGAICHGVNIEGSFISKKRRGSHDQRYIFDPDINLVKKWMELSNNNIRVITIAPEKTSEEFIKFLVDNDIVPSIGHSHATYEETKSALENGASYFTHLGNATGMMHQREPGLVGAALLDDKSAIEIICDGVHLHSAIVQVFVKVKGWDKVIIVSDGTCVMGMPPGRYKWDDTFANFDGQTLKIENEDTIAGGTLPLNKALKNLINFTDCTLSAAVRMTSLRPSRLLNIDKEYGSLSPGKFANIVLLDNNFDVVKTFVKGKLVYSKE